MGLYLLLGQNLGLAIISFTILLRLLMWPITVPSLKASQKMRVLQPELEKLKKKYANDKQKLASAQLELYKQHGASPVAGCLPWIVQLIVLIALFRAFNQVLGGNGQVGEALNNLLYPFLKLPSDMVLNTKFLYLDLTKPDLINLPFSLDLNFFKLDKVPGVFLLASALVQFWSSKMMLPVAPPPTVKNEKKEEDMAMSMQRQMLFLMPAMTVLIGFSFPSGLVLYWLALSSAMIVQQWLLVRNKADEKEAK
jgi:YidC/Oxa1 family membrane protein insertase